MKEHEALLKAQAAVKLPKKYGDHWLVKYRKDDSFATEKFFTEEAAYNFFYTKLREFKEQYLKEPERTK